MSYRDFRRASARNIPERAQKLDRIIVIRTMVQSKNETSGESVETPATFATVWASVAPWQGREFNEAGQLQAEVTTRFHIRYLEGLKATMTIVYAGKTFEIFRLEEIGRRDRLNIYAKAREE